MCREPSFCLPEVRKRPLEEKGTTVGPDPKQLERPIWSALTTTHASFALGNDLARRYPPDISPMAAVRDVSEEPCLQSLTKLLAPGDVVGRSVLSRSLRTETWP